jgi:L-arabinokinase
MTGIRDAAALVDGIRAVHDAIRDEVVSACERQSTEELSGLEVLGIDSGIRHAVSGADYGTVRAAAFMGYRIVADLAGLAARSSGTGRVTADDPRFGGYLANVSPGLWREQFRDAVPNGSPDASSSPATRAPPMTRPPSSRRPSTRSRRDARSKKQARVGRFRDLLAGVRRTMPRASPSASSVRLAADACGLAPTAPTVWSRWSRLRPGRRPLQRKITAGGGSGTVAVLAASGPPRRVGEIAARYGPRPA